jgi:hypothetical protein
MVFVPFEWFRENFQSVIWFGFSCFSSLRIWKSQLFWYNVNCPGPRLNETQQDWNLGLEYNKYLQEVVSILESDPDFRKKLENAKVRMVPAGVQISCKYMRYCFSYLDCGVLKYVPTYVQHLSMYRCITSVRYS